MKPKVSELLKKINWMCSAADVNHLSKLERDLLLGYVRDLYDTLLDPHYIERVVVNNNIEEPTKSVATTEKVDVKPVEVVAPVQELPKEVSVEKDNVTKTEIVESVVKAVYSINESAFTKETINEKIKVAAADDVFKRLSAKPLKDLMDLNKRYVVLSELFKGNSDAYNACIEYIDGSSSFTEAEAYVKSECEATFNWEPSAQSVRMFYKLIKQKFGVE